MAILLYFVGILRRLGSILFKTDLNKLSIPFGDNLNIFSCQINLFIGSQTSSNSQSKVNSMLQLLRIIWLMLLRTLITDWLGKLSFFVAFHFLELIRANSIDDSSSTIKFFRITDFQKRENSTNRVKDFLLIWRMQQID